MRQYIRKPSIFVDYLQFLQSRENVVQTYSVQEDSLAPPNANFFGYKNLGQRKSFNIGSGNEIIIENIRVLGRFLNNINYIAFYGHTLASAQTDVVVEFTAEDGNTYTNHSFLSKVNGGEGFTTGTINAPVYDGFSLLSIVPSLDDEKVYKKIAIIFYPTVADVSLDLALVTMGRQFTFPHNTDLKAQVSFVNEDIQKSKTSTKREIVQVLNQGRPKHGKMIPFQLYLEAYDEFDDSANDLMSLAMRTSRARFKFQVSYIDDEKLLSEYNLPYDQQGRDLAGVPTPFGDSDPSYGTYDKHSSLSTILGLITYSGQLPFMICTDIDDTYDTLNEPKNHNFYIVKNRKKNLDFKPISPTLYNMKFDLEEYV